MKQPDKMDIETELKHYFPMFTMLSSTWQSAIIRDAHAKSVHYRSEWADVSEFVSAYIETVNSNFVGQFPSNIIRWDFWGELLHSLELGR